MQHRPAPALIRPATDGWLKIGILLLVLVLAGCTDRASTRPVKVLAKLSHDPSAFTEGLLIHDNTLFESTGRYGASEIRRIDLVSGRVETRHALADRYFGEGLARIGDRLYQLTWKSGIGFVYDPDTLAVVDRFHYPGQGWGLTRWHDRLVMSDGSNELRFLEPGTFKVTRRLRVTEHGEPVSHLNELETVDGEIWANVWLSDRIVRIDPVTGVVRGALDAAALSAGLPASAGVLNGIAYDADRDRIYITGKYWPTLVQIARPGPG